MTSLPGVRRGAMPLDPLPSPIQGALGCGSHLHWGFHDPRAIPHQVTSSGAHAGVRRGCLDFCAKVIQKKKSPHKEFIFYPTLSGRREGSVRRTVPPITPKARNFRAKALHQIKKKRKKGSCLYLLVFSIDGLLSFSAPSSLL